MLYEPRRIPFSTMARTAMFLLSEGFRFSFAADFPQVKQTCWHWVHWEWNEMQWFYLPHFLGELSYLYRKIYFRKVLLFLWSQNVPLLHHSYSIGNHFIQFITRVASVAFFVICGHKWYYKQVMLQTRRRYCHQVTRLFNFQIWNVDTSLQQNSAKMVI